MFAYIHIPFCESKCKYCRFSSFSSLDESKIAFYVDYLIRQIEKYDEKIELLDSIYFGGGTPSYINQKYIEKIVFSLHERFGFNENIEITLESTPQNITLENIEIWNKNGVSRISLGVQSLQSKALSEIGRGDVKNIFSSLELLSKHPFKSTSVDFIIGLPFVEKGILSRDISSLLDSYPYINHVSVYMLEEYYYGEKWKNLILNDEDFLDEFTQTKNTLENKGFLQYELSNYAKPGYECKHNKAYWNHSNVIAFGLSAHGFINGVRFAFPDTFSSYYTGKFDFTESLTKNDITLEKIMFGLRTIGITKDLFSLLDFTKVEKFIQLSFLDMCDEKIILGKNGYTLLDYILKEIIL